MYPPGRLVFLRPFKGKGPQQTVWDAVWVDAPGAVAGMTWLRWWP